jgi:hypothetical protein
MKNNNDPQEMKRRLAQAEKVAQRLWKALAMETLEEARAFRDRHVSKPAEGPLVLITD